VGLTLGLAGLAGLALATALVAYQGLGAVTGALAQVGWGLIAVTLFHLVPLGCSALGWRSLWRGFGGAGVWTFAWVRWVREAADNLLPVAQVGGEMIGARLLALRGTSLPHAAASVIVDVTVEVLTQLLFTALGLALLLSAGGEPAIVRWVILGLVAALPAVTGFVLIQRYGFFRLVERLGQSLERRWPGCGLDRLEGLQDAIHAMYGRVRNGLAAATWHLASWVLGAGEVWLILYLMGRPVAPHEALVLESLGHAIRSAVFVVPGALGFQEGGYMVLGTLFGLPPQAGLALSLAKRVRELLLGVPALVVWQLVEGRRLWRSRNAELHAPARLSAP
jgi:putative membrane protein